MGGRISGDMLAPIDTLLAGLPPDLPFDLSQFELPAAHQLPVLYLGLGAVLLLAGRRLFWFSLGLAGFAIGLAAMSYVDFPPSAPPWTPYAAAAVFGLLGFLLAIFVQRFVVGAVGFIAGGLAAIWLAATFEWPVELWLTQLGLAPPVAGTWGWLLLFFIGGAALAALAGYLFEAALIVLSSLGGALLVVAVTDFDPQIDLVLLPALALLGMLAQAGTFGRSKRKAVAEPGDTPSRSVERRRKSD